MIESATPLLERELDFQEDYEVKEDKGWSVVVFNDDINLVEHVVRVFKKVLKMSQEKAEFHTMQVHVTGKSVVKFGTYDECFNITAELLKYYLHASLVKN